MVGAVIAETFFSEMRLRIPSDRGMQVRPAACMIMSSPLLLTRSTAPTVLPYWVRRRDRTQP